MVHTKKLRFSLQLNYLIFLLRGVIKNCLIEWCSHIDRISMQNLVILDLMVAEKRCLSMRDGQQSLCLTYAYGPKPSHTALLRALDILRSIPIAQIDLWSVFAVQSSLSD